MRRRAEARRRAKHRCRICRTAKDLHVHHKTYKRLGQETPADLIVLCAEHHFGCHAFIREWRRRRYRRLSDYALTMKYVARERKKWEKSQGK